MKISNLSPGVPVSALADELDIVIPLDQNKRTRRLTLRELLIARQAYSEQLKRIADLVGDGFIYRASDGTISLQAVPGGDASGLIAAHDASPAAHGALFTAVNAVAANADANANIALAGITAHLADLFAHNKQSFDAVLDFDMSIGAVQGMTIAVPAGVYSIERLSMSPIGAVPLVNSTLTTHSLTGGASAFASGLAAGTGAAHTLYDSRSGLVPSLVLAAPATLTVQVQVTGGAQPDSTYIARSVVTVRRVPL